MLSPQYGCQPRRDGVQDADVAPVPDASPLLLRGVSLVGLAGRVPRQRGHRQTGRIGAWTVT